jgi:hypothetical protein
MSATPEPVNMSIFYFLYYCNFSEPEQLRFANPFKIAFGDGICSHLNHVRTVSAASASTCSEQLTIIRLI